MDAMLQEILEIPEKASELLNQPTIELPLRVPYLGMGSSYFAPLAFKFMGIEIYPEMASEYYNYLVGKDADGEAVIISQSGKSTEALWCRSLFKQYIAMSNYTQNELCTAENVKTVVPMLAGDEHYSSSKTYINTLLLFFKGFGFDAREALDLMMQNMQRYRLEGTRIAESMFDLLKTNTIHGIYVTGSGPNTATAMQAALILSESTKLNFNGLTMAQYDHGPKETAKNSIVINIVAKGKSYERTKKLSALIASAGAHVFEIEEPDTEEHFSVLHNIIPFNFLGHRLAQLLEIGETFVVGGKVTEVI